MEMRQEEDDDVTETVIERVSMSVKMLSKAWEMRCHMGLPGPRTRQDEGTRWCCQYQPCVHEDLHEWHRIRGTSIGGI